MALISKQWSIWESGLMPMYRNRLSHLAGGRDNCHVQWGRGRLRPTPQLPCCRHTPGETSSHTAQLTLNHKGTNCVGPLMSIFSINTSDAFDSQLGVGRWGGPTVHWPVPFYQGDWSSLGRWRPRASWNQCLGIPRDNLSFWGFKSYTWISDCKGSQCPSSKMFKDQLLTWQRGQNISCSTLWNTKKPRTIQCLPKKMD